MTGEPQLLTDGLGRVWGSWVILAINDQRSVLMDDGQPRKLGFDLTLREYGEDDTLSFEGWNPFDAWIGLFGGSGQHRDALAGCLRHRRGPADMSTIVTTRPDDMIDAICFRHYGRVDVLPVVLEANRHLAKQPPVLPDGLQITLPALGAEPEAPIIRLWS